MTVRRLMLALALLAGFAAVSGPVLADNTDNGGGGRAPEGK
jgi:hypothetical protein